jgi:hypothetical protein
MTQDPSWLNGWLVLAIVSGSIGLGVLCSWLEHRWLGRRP